MSDKQDNTDSSYITKEEIWAFEEHAEKLCEELSGKYRPLFVEHDYDLMLEVFRIDFNLSTKKGIIRHMSKDDVLQLGYYSAIDVSILDSNGVLVDVDRRELKRNITLWGCYKRFFKVRHIMNTSTKEELQALMESTINGYAATLELELDV
ncbi:MAG: hypothetical protein Q8J63_04980 [Candidatus Aquicultor sp.]|nr:hypothetical protein [Candidatus Aquicultor sp.]